MDDQDRQEIDNNRFIPLSDLSKKYWFIKYQGWEWYWIIRRLIVRQNSQLYEVVVGNSDEEWHTFYLLKERFPAEVLAAAFGVTTERIHRYPVIQLNPFPIDHSLPIPTVDAYGEA